MVKGNQPTRILRNYRYMSPGNFHSLNQRIRKGLTDNENIPESTWSLLTPGVLQSYFSASDLHDAVYHKALYGSKLDIAERDLLQTQLIEYLDEIATILEAAAYHNPNILLTSGFDLAKDRRNRTRSNVSTTASEELNIPDREHL